MLAETTGPVRMKNQIAFIRCNQRVAVIKIRINGIRQFCAVDKFSACQFDPVYITMQSTGSFFPLRGKVHYVVIGH